MVQVSPAGTGTTTPGVGSTAEPTDTVIPLTATANPGYVFVDWTGAVADPTSASTTVTMDQPQTVTANFAIPTACVGDCDGNGSVTIDEILTLVNIVLGNGGVCVSGLTAGVTPDVSLIIQAVNNDLDRCPAG